MSSRIAWTNEVWNPVTGCTKVSTGCTHCYAEAITKRFGGHFQAHNPTEGRGKRIDDEGK